MGTVRASSPAIRIAAPAQSMQAKRQFACWVARQAVRSLYAELRLYPKPGLVSMVDSGSHDDMDAVTFMRSLFSLRHYFRKICLAGYNDAAFAELKRLGIAAEADMLKATRGVNTHRGAIFSLGLLCATAGRARAQGTPMTPPALRAAMLIRWGEELAMHAAPPASVSAAAATMAAPAPVAASMATRSASVPVAASAAEASASVPVAASAAEASASAPVAASAAEASASAPVAASTAAASAIAAAVACGAGHPPLSNGLLVAARYAVSGAREEGALGLPSVFEIGVRALQASHARGASHSEARIDALFALMAHVSDSNVYHRAGPQGAQIVRDHAQRFLALGGTAYPRWHAEALASHQVFVARRLSPGGAADLLAASCLVLALGATDRP